MSLQNYWPNVNEINLCINNEAEGAHDAVLLAVHQPTPLSYRIISSDRILETTEEDLFNYLISEDVPSGSHLVPITGASGVGKSHMVRVLAARLQSINSDGRYVIIRIPKSASLRNVVESILAELPGDDYAEVRASFSKAVEEVNLENAVINFQSQLNIALIELAKNLKTQVKSDPANAVLKEQCGHALELPNFMADPILVEHFRNKVFPRIVNRALSGQHLIENVDLVQDFKIDDFVLPESIDITHAALPTKRYYQTNLQIRNGRSSAIRLLNESNVIDLAIKQLFNLHHALGGMTLQEVIQEIRRMLLTQNRELVILVEDFKALTGIQDTLLNVLIQEGVRDGVRGLATMRSVIAVTDGYLAGKDTIGTRSKREWIVQSTLSDDEVLKRTKSLVAAYVNAARWGYDELVRQFNQSGGTWSGNATWIEPYGSDDSEKELLVLNAFGRIRGIPLFPYTDLAIEQLARTALTRNNKLIFTPRFIIDNVLRSILLPGRSSFVQGRFPHVGIDAPKVNAEVTQWLMTRPVSEDDRERYRRVVGIWGNEPQTSDDIGFIPGEVFDAFGLERPGVKSLVRQEPIIPLDQKQTPSSIPPSPLSPPSQPDETVIALENWVQKNELLKQNIANQIRQGIATAINERINWNAERCLRSPFLILPKDISIPHASGEGNISGNNILIALENSDLTGQLRLELIAVVRFYKTNNGKMNYIGVDDDLVWIGNLVERLLPRALELVRNNVHFKMRMSLRLLMTNSRILGMPELDSTASSLYTFLFRAVGVLPIPSEDSQQEFLDWNSLQDKARIIRPELIQMVLDCCGSFQGLGKTSYAVDISRVNDCMPSEGEAMENTILNLFPIETKELLKSMAENRVKPLARKVLLLAKRIGSTLTTEFGPIFDKQALVTELTALADLLKDSGIWNLDDIGMDHEAYQKLCEAFAKSELHESLAFLNSEVESDRNEESNRDLNSISFIGRLDGNPLIVAMRFVDISRKLVKVSDRRAKILEEQFKGVDPQSEIDRIQYLLKGLREEIVSLGTEGDVKCS
jgi:hypothetical protein